MMKNYIPGILMIGLGILLLGASALSLVFAYDVVVSYLNSLGAFTQVAIFIVLASLLFIGTGIYLIIKEKQENKRLDRLDAFGERRIGVIKNLVHDEKHYDSIHFTLEVQLSEKKKSKHDFLSPELSYRNFRLQNGMKLYVIYDKKNLDNYVICYDHPVKEEN